MTTSIKSTGIIKGALILGIAMFLSKIIGFLYRIPITSILGDTGNAIYGVAFNIYVVLLGVSAIGIPGGISKLVAECLAKGTIQDAKKVFRVALFYTGAVSGLLSLGLFVGAEFIAVQLNGMEELILPLRILSPTIFIASLMAVVRGYFQGMNTMLPTAISQVVEQLFNALFSVVLATYFIQYGVAIAAAGSTIGTGIGALCGFLILILLYKKNDPTNQIPITSTKPLFKSRREIIYKLLSIIIPVVITTSIFSIFSVIDASMLSNKLPSAVDYLRASGLVETIPVSGAATLSTMEIVTSLIGQYTTKYFTLINIPISLILIVSVSAIPSISKSYALGDRNGLTDKISQILRIGLLLSIPASFGLMIFAKPIMYFMFTKHPDGGELVMHGALTIIFITTAQLSSSILQGMGKQYVPTLFAIIALSVKFILNSILLRIPTLHIYSVIYSTLIAYMVFALLCVYYLKYKVGLNLHLGSLYLYPLLCSIIMSILGLSSFYILNNLFNFPNINLILSIALCILIYGLSGFLSGMLKVEDLPHFGKKI